jgi:hypothetical protein
LISGQTLWHPRKSTPGHYIRCDAEKLLNLNVHQIRPLEPFKVGPYAATAVPASHAPGMGAMLYAIEANGRALFYGTDAGPLFQKTWQVFRERKMRFDVVILDHTIAPNKGALTTSVRSR